MSNKPKDASEQIFQENFVKELVKYKWVAPEELNGNAYKVTVDDLINHWRQELNRLNASSLEGVPLTDGEFSQVMAKVNQINNSYEASKLLSMEQSNGRIDGIFRDNHPDVTRKQITLDIFKKAQVGGGESTYKIAREVQTDNGNRFDIVLLINGLPLINIEQKRTDKSLDEAIGQFKRYYKDGEYVNNFMAFSQMMVVTTEIETRYFATLKSLKDFNPSFVFHWSIKQEVERSGNLGKAFKQRIVSDWREVVKEFLMIPMAHQMVGDYLVIDEAEDEENRRHMLMRPYQVQALQAIESAAFGYDNKDKIPHGGFVWHTTGSGKTITSYKTALFLSQRAGFDKVIFLVDRKDLDKQTIDSYTAYSAYENVTVDKTQYTSSLRQSLTKRSGIVVTTTFKLNSLVKQLNEAQDDSLKNKRFVFIIDEAHRTTMGEMMITIRGYFKQNGLFFGFTGTPLFDDNKVRGMINEKSELINTTEKLFGPLLHQYTIDEAIADGNVLGFHIDYLNTGEFASYEQLREKLLELRLNDKEEHQSKKELERSIQALSDLEIEKEAHKTNLITYQDQTHIPRVVTEILDNWYEQSQGAQFNAMLTVAYKERVIQYYREFKKQISEREDHQNVPNVAMTFSFGNENDLENVSRDIEEEMFADYEQITGVHIIPGDNKKGEKFYFEDLTERVKRGGSGRNPKNIDLVIVADQLLTGFDAKRLNTLYVDRKLELQGLIQAYSRTNRVFGKDKEFGSIINFQWPKMTEEYVSQALKLYGSGGKNSRVTVEKYSLAVEAFASKVKTLRETMKDPSKDWILIKDNEEAKTEYRKVFVDANSQLNKVSQYYEFEWDDDRFGIDEHLWMMYYGAYKNLKGDNEDGGGDDEVILPLFSRTKLQSTQVIDAQHILNLIGSNLFIVNGTKQLDAETLRLVYEQIQELSNMGQNDQAELLKKFVDEEVADGNFSSDRDFTTAFTEWKEDIRNSVITEFASEWGVNPALLISSVDEYSAKNPDYIPFGDEISKTLDPQMATNEFKGKKLLLNMKLKAILPKWMNEVKKKY
ncbi:type I restriction endonuclease subunit R [Streptococcus ictaluri]|uniref:Type I restriction enzyme endonuclease subunit n=1 Tax=Streptococcus ictaluri 707-05 TaxID=764299 RepID=G5K541_9STRE|nr:HsdR family type I site-specific deoxyribonuclease [Streptococcus ictaluri]EHI68898.1 type I site-specific deoxyribonuclease, HsdR family [Streptococcus ictaluri 707-05]